MTLSEQQALLDLVRAAVQDLVVLSTNSEIPLLQSDLDDIAQGWGSEGSLTGPGTARYILQAVEEEVSAIEKRLPRKASLRTSTHVLARE